jgi:hypothetical protein
VPPRRHSFPRPCASPAAETPSQRPCSFARLARVGWRSIRATSTLSLVLHPSYSTRYCQRLGQFFFPRSFFLKKLFIPCENLFFPRPYWCSGPVERAISSAGLFLPLSTIFPHVFDAHSLLLPQIRRSGARVTHVRPRRSAPPAPIHRRARSIYHLY